MWYWIYKLNTTIKYLILPLSGGSGNKVADGVPKNKISCSIGSPNPTLNIKNAE